MNYSQRPASNFSAICLRSVYCA